MKTAELNWTIKDILKWGEERFRQKSVQKPRLYIEHLLSSVLNKTRLELYLNFDEPLSRHELTALKEAIKRCEKGEPLAYVIGKVDFHDITLQIDSSVLIPRPETEHMVDTAIGAMDKRSTVRLLDLGCGSGAITLACLKHRPDWSAVAVDIDEKALHWCRHNTQLNKITNEIEWVHEDMTLFLSREHPRFDLVISNPPYVSKDEYDVLDPSVRLHEPQIALTDMSDGLTYIRLILSRLSHLLKPDGMAFIEFGYKQAPFIEKILEEIHFFDYEILKDYQQHHRFIKIRYKDPSNIEQEVI